VNHAKGPRAAALDAFVAAAASYDERATTISNDHPVVTPGLTPTRTRAIGRLRELTAREAHRLATFSRTALCSEGKSCAVEAKRLGIARTTLQPFASLTRWSEGELSALLEHRGPTGGRLTISHLLLTARLPARTCEQMNSRVIHEGLTVRQLRDVLRQARPSSTSTT
jgi:hypothetical protein